jgi:Fe-S oxidoreductase
MVLLADLISDDAAAIEAAAAQVVLLTEAREGEGFIATSPEARQRFWVERKRTAAIAAHTNAFKINEDVVIPLARLGDYSDGIERMNIVQSTQNKLRMIVALRAYLNTEIQGHHADEEAYLNSAENQQIALAKKQRALALLDEIENHWQSALDHLDEPVSKHPQLRAFFPVVAEDNTLFSALQSREWRVSYQQAIAKPLKDIFSGEHLAEVRAQFDVIHTEIRASRLFIALHMHAGDGNVHTNIPVNSHDYQMLHEAESLVDQIMALTQSLGGVISGEHGIGLTKWQYLSSEKREAFARYKQKVDPKGFFNRGKLLTGADLERAYTPSLRLLSQEALILEATDLGDLNASIKDCLRCGKCKPHCTTHVPEANLLYSPRDKILATGLLIEAVLYEEQTRRGISAHHFDAMNDVADHCTVCHRCFNPCPVDIDFGDVTIKMRNILRQQKKKHFNPISWASLQFLNVSHPSVVKWMRLGMIQAGYLGQRLAYQSAKYIGLNKPKQPVKTTGHTALVTQVINFVDKPLPKNVPAQPLRHLLKIEDETKVAIIRDPNKVTDNSDAVFYFPGCGSERLFSQIGMATLAMLHDLGTQTVLPPGYLCCGYPQSAAGETQKGQQISTANRVLFHRVANTLNYLDIKTVLVSCGTCMDQLLKYEFEQIFPHCRLLDIHEYLMEKGVQIEGVSGTKYLYHEPCHTPMKTHHSSQVAEKLLKQTVPMTDRCCGEAGTFAIARPDIAMQVRLRKQATLTADKAALNNAEKQPVKVLTSCPACQQGLARFTDDTAMETDYIVVELAQQKWGKTWQQDFLQRLSPSNHEQSGIEQVLL